MHRGQACERRTRTSPARHLGTIFLPIYFPRLSQRQNRSPSLDRVHQTPPDLFITHKHALRSSARVSTPGPPLRRRRLPPRSLPPPDRLRLRAGPRQGPRLGRRSRQLDGPLRRAKGPSVGCHAGHDRSGCGERVGDAVRGGRPERAYDGFVGGEARDVV